MIDTTEKLDGFIESAKSDVLEGYHQSRFTANVPFVLAQTVKDLMEALREIGKPASTMGRIEDKYFDDRKTVKRALATAEERIKSI